MTRADATPTAAALAAISANSQTLRALITQTNLGPEEIARAAGVPLAAVFGWFDGWESYGFIGPIDRYSSAEAQAYGAGYLAGEAYRAEAGGPSAPAIPETTTRKGAAA